MKEYCPFQNNEECFHQCKLFVYIEEDDAEGTCALASIAWSLFEIARKIKE